MSNSPTPLIQSLRGYVVCAVLLLCPLVYSFAFTSFLFPKEMVIAAGVLVLAILGLFRPVPIAPGLWRYAPLWLGLVVTLLLHTLPGTTRVPVEMWQDGARFALLLLFATLAFPLWSAAEWRHRAGMALGISGALVALSGLAQYAGLAGAFLPAFAHYDQRMYSVFGNQDHFGGYLAIVLPLVVFALLRSQLRHPSAWCALLPIMLALSLSGSRSAWLAAVVGVVALRPWRAGQREVTVLAVGALLAAIVGVFLNYNATLGRVALTFRSGDIGGNARLWFWDGTLRMIADAPWIGRGLGNYAYWSPHYLGEALSAAGGERHFHNTVHTIHAHSEPLEFLAETGIVGLIFGMAWILGLLRLRGPAWGGLAALAVFSCFNGALHSAPHILVGLVLAGMLLRVPVGAAATGARLLPVLVAALLTGFLTWACWLPDLRLRRAEAIHVAGGDPLPYYEAALDGRPPSDVWHSGECLFAYGLALNAVADPRTAEVLDAAQARMDTGALYLLLGEHALQRDERENAKVYLRACLYRWPGSRRAFWQLYEIADVAERARLDTHAARWGILSAP